MSTEHSLETLRHSAAHIMARAVMRLFPDVQLAFGPATDNGFYYDFAMEHKLSEEDFPKIEAEINALIKLNEEFERIELPLNEAVELLTGIGQTLKVEHLNESLSGEEKVSFYRQGEFVDMCRGPHIPKPKLIGAVKLMSVAGAYWKGDASKQQLQRLYATAFFDKKDLADHLHKLEEAKKRDHRVLGKQHELFAIDSRVGQGLILWLPKGAIVRRQLEMFIMEELTKRGYTSVNTPVIGNIELYKTSGHYPYYAESQFPPIKMQDGDEFLLRPMNCPHHVMVYEQKPRSYKDLPIRIAEFGCVHRFEQSGELNGMTRVRGFTQDDAHIFCMPEQVEEEFRACIEMTLMILKTLGFEDFQVRLSFRDWTSDKYVGKPENWKLAQAALEKVCKEMELPDLEIVEGEAAFYGPKADFVVKDCLGRRWQLGTVQLDYNLPSPERFNLEYTGSDNKPHTPVMIHRAPLGSFERFCGILIEHFAAAFPLWLAPEQIRILTVSDKFGEYGNAVLEKLQSAGLRASLDNRSEKIGAKIREGRLDLVPYLAVVGGKEAENGSVALRSRKDGELGEVNVEEVVKRLAEEVAQRSLQEDKNERSVTIEKMLNAAKQFCIAESAFDNPELFGITDGKAVGTYVEHKFQKYLLAQCSVQVGSSAKGIDFPSSEINTDVKVTSVRQPQSSCPFHTAEQKIFGLGYNLLVFVYDKIDDAKTQTSRLNFVNCSFIDKNRTADYQITKSLIELTAKQANEEEIIAFLIERNLPADEILLSQIAKKILSHPPLQGYLTISNALQWRLQYSRIVNLQENIQGIVKIYSEDK